MFAVCVLAWRLNKEAAVTEQHPPGATVKTGEICPQSGLWQVVGQPACAAVMAQGHMVPPCHGKTATWHYRGQRESA